MKMFSSRDSSLLLSLRCSHPLSPWNLYPEQLPITTTAHPHCLFMSSGSLTSSCASCASFTVSFSLQSFVLFHFHLSGAFLEPDVYSQELTLKVTNNSICSFLYKAILECSVSFRIQIKQSSSSVLMTALALCKVAAFKQSKYFMKTISTTLLNE